MTVGSGGPTSSGLRTKSSISSGDVAPRPSGAKYIRVSIRHAGHLAAPAPLVPSSCRDTVWLSLIDDGVEAAVLLLQIPHLKHAADPRRLSGIGFRRWTH